MPLTSWFACTYQISDLNLVRISTSRFPPISSYPVRERLSRVATKGRQTVATSMGIVRAMSFSQSCEWVMSSPWTSRSVQEKFLFNLTYPNRVSANFSLYLTNFVCPFALFCLASIVLFARRRAFPERSFQNSFFYAVFGRFFVRTKDKKRLRE